MQPKVTLGIPSYNHIPPQAYASMLSAVMENVHAQLLTGLDVRCEVFVAQSRNEIAEAFLELWHEGRATHLWFVDDDMVLPRGALARLLSYGRPVASALYCGREKELHVYQLDPFVRLTADKLPADPFLCDAVGLGCCLIEGQVLEDVKRWREPLFQYTAGVGEDIYFCEGLAAVGVKVLVDPGLVAGHCKSTVVVC